MATLSAISATNPTDTQIPFLPKDSVVDGAVDYKGRPVIRSQFGGWRSAWFIIVVEVTERIAYYGIGSNLISYLTGPLRQTTAGAAANVNAWSGVTYLLPLLGAIVADSYLGRFRTVVASSIIYILGLGLLTLSAMLTNSSSTSNYNTTASKSTVLWGSIDVQVLFFLSLYVVAIGQSGYKPCLQAFGADQFDNKDSKELTARSSFFNWLHFFTCVGVLVMVSVFSYIQENLNWALSYGIPCIMMVVVLFVFFLGTPMYRYLITPTKQKSPISRIGRRLIAFAARNCCAESSPIKSDLEARRTVPGYGSKQSRFLNKPLLSPTEDGKTFISQTEDDKAFISPKEDGNVQKLNDDIEEAKSVLRLFPIWATSLVYAVAGAQFTTFFTKQGVTMDRSIGQNFTVPAAALQSFIGLSAVCFVPIYEYVFVPIARYFTGEPTGVKRLQRIGMGMFLSTVCMVIAALVESMRLKIAIDNGLIDSKTVPMKVWWLIPQYALIGLADLFTKVGLQEFFYDQVPTELRSVGLSLYLSIFGFGNLLSGFVVTVIENSTKGDGDGWLADDLNRAHLDYFYCLLGGLNGVGMLLFMYFARAYKDKCSITSV